MAEVAQSARRVRVTMIPEGQQLFVDGVEVKVGDTFGDRARVAGKWTGTITEGATVPPPKAYGFALVDEVADADPTPVQASEGAELPPLTEAELKEIEAREKAATAGPWAFDNDKMRGDEIRHGDDVVLRSTMPWHDVTDIECAEADHAFIAAARTDVPRLLADLRRAHARIAELEAQIAATAEAHREDQRRADELAGVPG